MVNDQRREMLTLCSRFVGGVYFDEETIGNPYAP